MYTDLTGKTALVTGAGRPRGIGFGIARELAACGMDIVLADIPPPPEHGEPLMDACAAGLEKEFGVRVLAVELDVSSEDGVLEAVAAVKRFTPRLRTLVNNAGTNMGASRIGDYSPDLWRKVIDINLVGPFLLMRAFLPMMTRGSSVINVASRAGKRPLPTCSAYSTSKAGLIMLTKCMAAEYAQEGIRANAICPGQVLTEMNLRRYEREASAAGISREERMEEMMRTVPLGRIGLPDDIGRLAAFLASDASGYMTGQALNITGGQIMEL